LQLRRSIARITPRLAERVVAAVLLFAIERGGHPVGRRAQPVAADVVDRVHAIDARHDHRTQFVSMTHFCGHDLSYGIRISGARSVPSLALR
jgi:hypothetical protein